MGRPKKGTEAYSAYLEKRRVTRGKNVKEIHLKTKTNVTLQTKDGSSSSVQKPINKRREGKGKERANDKKPTQSTKPVEDVTVDSMIPKEKVSEDDEGDLTNVSLLDLVDPTRKESVPRINAPQRNLSSLYDRPLTIMEIRNALSKGIAYRLTPETWILNRLRKDGRLKHQWVHINRYVTSSNETKWDCECMANQFQPWGCAHIQYVKQYLINQEPLTNDQMDVIPLVSLNGHTRIISVRDRTGERRAILFRDSKKRLTCSQHGVFSCSHMNKVENVMKQLITAEGEDEDVTATDDDMNCWVEILQPVMNETEQPVMNETEPTEPVLENGNTNIYDSLDDIMQPTSEVSFDMILKNHEEQNETEQNETVDLNDTTALPVRPAPWRNVKEAMDQVITECIQCEKKYHSLKGKRWVHTKTGCMEMSVIGVICLKCNQGLGRQNETETSSTIIICRRFAVHISLIHEYSNIFTMTSMPFGTFCTKWNREYIELNKSNPNGVTKKFLHPKDFTDMFIYASRAQLHTNNFNCPGCANDPNNRIVIADGTFLSIHKSRLKEGEEFEKALYCYGNEPVREIDRSIMDQRLREKVTPNNEGWKRRRRKTRTTMYLLGQKGKRNWNRNHLLSNKFKLGIPKPLKLQYKFQRRRWVTMSRDENCTKYEREQSSRSGGVFCLFCPHGLCIGFHLIPVHEGHKDLYWALYK